MAAISFSRHLAAISPYFEIYRQPAVPVGKKITAAVYFLRHGNIEVSRYDYGAFIAPFIKKIEQLQSAGSPFVEGRLLFLEKYKSWITAAHVGLVSEKGLRETKELGKAFRIRYSQWLIPDGCNPKARPFLKIWTDSAERCARSAAAFGDGFSGTSSRYHSKSCSRLTETGQVDQTSKQPDDGLVEANIQTQVVRAEKGSKTCNNLSWHEVHPEIDQNLGNEQMRSLMAATSDSSLNELQGHWMTDTPLTVEDLYSMQLLHCYDIVSGRKSPFAHLFNQNDWRRFEYLRDVKYHYSEGYGSPHPGLYAIPGLATTIELLPELRTSEDSLPLRLCFTHREEILYMCCLLGISYQSGWEPSLIQVDENRPWRVSRLAPYLGHVGIETYDEVGSESRMRVRVIVNGEVRSAFSGEVNQQEDRGYRMDDVKEWMEAKSELWNRLNGGSLDFLKSEGQRF